MGLRTNDICYISTIIESSSRATWKINPIREVIDFSRRIAVNVVAIVNQRVSENEEAWNFGFANNDSL